MIFDCFIADEKFIRNIFAWFPFANEAQYFFFGCCKAVSYTHLDVYKRQEFVEFFSDNILQI